MRLSVGRSWGTAAAKILNTWCLVPWCFGEINKGKCFKRANGRVGVYCGYNLFTNKKDFH